MSLASHAAMLAWDSRIIAPSPGYPGPAVTPMVAEPE